MPSTSTSTTLNGPELLVLHPPSSLTECVPANISWTGGMPPYSLQINLGTPGEMVQQFDDIFATSFVWSTNVAAGTQVSFQLGDQQTDVLQLEPMYALIVGAGPDTACVYNPLLSTSSGVITIPSFSSSTRISTLPSASASRSSIFQKVIPTASATSVMRPQQSLIPASQTVQRASPLNGATTAFLVLGLLTLLLVFVGLWWRSRANGRRKAGNDSEKQEVINEGHKSEAVGLWSDDESTEIETSDDQVDISDETPSAPSMDQSLVPTATLVSIPERQTTADSAPASPIEPFAPRFSSSKRTTDKGAPLRRRLSSVQSDAGTISDTGAARLSTSTNSTLPPSYRTRRSSIYAPPPSAFPLPPFPPPAYTPENLKPPPGAFRLPRRARGGGLATTSKLGEGRARDSVSASAGAESPTVPDGMQSDATRIEGREEGTEETLAQGSPLSDSKGGPSNVSLTRVSFADARDSVSETGATILSADRET